jgi:alpha-ketoglutarate-dependent taurine dioxygenase
MVGPFVPRVPAGTIEANSLDRCTSGGDELLFINRPGNPSSAGSCTPKGEDVGVEITPIKPDIGVVITGICGRGFVDPEVAAQADELLDTHGVLIYRGADIGDDDLLAFSRLLGPVHDFGRPSNDEYSSQMGVVSRDPAKSRSAAVQYGTFQWHVDGTMDEHPHRMTLLTCVETASDGSGDTEFANTYAAYDELSEEEKATLEGLVVRYSYLNRKRLRTMTVTPEAEAAWRSRPPRERPLLWKHHTGRTSLLLGAQAGEVLGWPLDKGEALLDRLLAFATQPRFTIRHHWERGDLVIWDNTGILHRAHPYEVDSGRLMHRTTVDGPQAA